MRLKGYQFQDLAYHNRNLLNNHYSFMILYAVNNQTVTFLSSNYTISNNAFMTNKNTLQFSFYNSRFPFL